MPDGGFCVMSKDYYRLPLDTVQVKDLEHNFLELICEEDPKVRSGVYPSLEIAIRAFEADFDNEPESAERDSQHESMLKTIARTVQEIGVAEAAKSLGIPRGTLVKQLQRDAERVNAEFEKKKKALQKPGKVSSK